MDGGPGPAGRDRRARTQRFYFLMAATAFTAASSRFSAAVMGRPLSVRILLASCTLVPGRDEKRTVTGGRPGEVKPEGAQTVAGGRGYGGAAGNFAKPEGRRASPEVHAGRRRGAGGMINKSTSFYIIYTSTSIF